MSSGENKLQNFISNIPGIIFRCLPDSGWTMLFISSDIKELTGYPAEHFTGKSSHSYNSIIHPDDRKNVSKKILMSISENKTYSLSYRIIDRNKKVRWVQEKGRASYDKNGNAEYIDGLIIDITQQKRTENRLREKTEELEAYFSSALDLLCIADTEGNFIRVNREWERILGYKARDLEKRKFLEFVHPDDIQATLDAMAKLESQEIIENFTNRYRCKDGSYRYIEWRSTPVGTLIYAAARDITKRKEAENALRRSEEYSRSIIEVIPDIIIRMGENAEIKDIVSSAGEKLYVPREKAIGKKVSEVIPGETGKKLSDAVKRVFSTKKLEIYEYKLQIENELLWFEARIVPSGKTEAVSLIRDITEKKRAEDKKNFQMEFQKIAAESAASYVGLSSDEEFDRAVEKTLKRLGELYGVDRSYIFTFTSDLNYMTNTHEWCSPEVESHKDRLQDIPTDSMPWWKNEIKKNRPVHIPDVEELPADASAEKKEFRAQKIKSLVCLPMISGRGLLTGFMGFDSVRAKFLWEEEEISMLQLLAGIIGNVIERRRAATLLDKAVSKLKEREQRLSLVIEGGGVGTWDWHLPSGGFVFNERWEDILGYRLEELSPDAVTWEKLTHPDDSAVMRKKIRDCLEGKTSGFESEIRMRNKNGNWVWVLDKGKVFERDKSGKPLRVCGTIIDITGRKELEALKDEFVNTISHEMRTPLAIIKESINLAEKNHENKNPEKEIHFLNMAKRNITRLSRLINNVLDYQKLVAGKMDFDMKTEDINPLIENVVEEMQPVARKKNIEIRFNPGSNENFACFDYDRIAQVIINLLNNALKFTDQGHIEIKIEETENYLNVSVKDTGIGIRKENLENLFQDFKQFSEGRQKSSEGTGLGLAISKKIIQQHGGTIGAESEYGKGTRVYFSLPGCESG